MEQIARLKSEILTLLDEELAKMNDEEISVPVGSLLFPDVFAGRGFSIPVRVLALNSTNADFTARSSRSASTRAYSRSALPSPSAYRFSRRLESRIRT